MRATSCRSTICAGSRRRFRSIARASNCWARPARCATSTTRTRCAAFTIPRPNGSSPKRPARAACSSSITRCGGGSPAPGSRGGHAAAAGDARARRSYRASRARNGCATCLATKPEELLKGRVQIINLWRPIRGPLRDAPLAVCDARSVAPAIWCRRIWCIATGSGRPTRSPTIPAHRWFYVPEMQPDEALLLKCFDSATDGRARFMPHTAFDDPTAPADIAAAGEHRTADVGVSSAWSLTGGRQSGGGGARYEAASAGFRSPARRVGFCFKVRECPARRIARR